MDVAETTESIAQPGVDLSRVIGDVDIALDSLGDDGRSSSLSEIDDVSDNEPSDDELPPPQRSVPEEADSEAETERLEDSPNNHRLQPNIKLTATSRFESSPSKLAQSTTYDEMEEDEENELTETPSKTRRSSKTNGGSENIETPTLDDAESPHSHADVAGKKRKRPQANEDVDTEMGEDDEPLRKRRGSVGADDIQDEAGGDALTTREETEEVGQHDTSGKETPLDEAQDSAAPAVATRAAKRGVKKGKRKGRRARDTDEDLENGAENTEDQLQEDEETGDVADDAHDAEAAAKSEEECKSLVSVCDDLIADYWQWLEKLQPLTLLWCWKRNLRHFGKSKFDLARVEASMLMLYRIYDEKIAKIDRELEQLTSPEPTHPELLRQLECLQRHRDKKINYEHTLYQYRMQSLMSRSLADRAQIHSTYFQRIRDTREKHSTAVSKQFYAIQHDRFKTEELGAHHYIPFPTRRSQQISQQAAYNQEVSVMAGVAKYVGFPAAPTLSAARTTEIDDDFEKMGVSQFYLILWGAFSSQ